MEPTFSSPASLNSVTPELQAQIDAAIATLPAAHQRAPYKGEIVDSKEAALQRLQDWAFTHGFAIAIESGSKNRVWFECVHHKKKTRNTRKTTEDDRTQVETKTQSKDC